MSKRATAATQTGHGISIQGRTAAGAYIVNGMLVDKVTGKVLSFLQAEKDKHGGSDAGVTATCRLACCCCITVSTNTLQLKQCSSSDHEGIIP
jgi:hypothetical protein